jgi:hypothetical protein
MSHRQLQNQNKADFASGTNGTIQQIFLSRNKNAIISTLINVLNIEHKSLRKDQLSKDLVKINFISNFLFKISIQFN